MVVEQYQSIDESDGFSEKCIYKKTPEFYKERNVGPRFATRGSFQADYAARWKALIELYKTKEEALKHELQLEQEKLESQMELVEYDRITEMLRQELQQREQKKAQHKEEYEARERNVEERRRAHEESLIRQTEELNSRLQRQVWFV